MTEAAEYVPGYPVHLAIDCGVSRHVAAVWFQVGPVRYAPGVAPAGSPRAGAPRAGGWFAAAAGSPLVAEHGPRSTVTVFGDFHCEGLYSEAAARAIVAHGPDAARLRRDVPTWCGWTRRRRRGPGSGRRRTRSSNGSSAPMLARWPSHRVTDGLDQLEVLLDQGCLLLHPRCVPPEIGVPELRAASGRRAATGRTSRRTRSTRTRT